MTRQASFKRRVRERMTKTGESYAAARSQLLGGPSGEGRPAALDDPMAAALHLTNGDSTDLPGTGVARRVLVWFDVLHEGPVPDVGPEEFRRTRAAFLTTADPVGGGEFVLDRFVERDRTLEANAGGEYVLWFEADLYDQLQIVQILARLAELGVAAERITLICIGEYPGIARFGGLGELKAEQLRALPDSGASAPLTAAALDLAGRAWAALRSPEPRDLGAIAASRSSELRFLGEAFDRLSREYPWTRDGLSLIERRVLAAAADAEHDAETIFLRVGARESRPYLGDTWCFAAMDRLVRAPVPLMAADSDGAPVERRTRLRLTAMGGRVLAGTEDHVALNGVDRWIGGVHLQGHDLGWRFDEGTEAIVATR